MSDPFRGPDQESSHWCSTRALTDTDVVEPPTSHAELAAALVDANAAARGYSTHLLERELTATLDVERGAVARFDHARTLGPGLIGVIESLMDGTSTPGVPRTPDALVRTVGSSAVVAFDSIGRHHRYLRRFDEHLRRVGWSAPSLQLVVLGTGCSWSAPQRVRRIVVQALGSSILEDLAGAPIELAPAAGVVTGGLGVGLRADDGLSVVLVASDDGAGDSEVGSNAEPDEPAVAARQPAISSGSIGHLLNLDQQYRAGRLAARTFTVRNHHPGGAFGLDGDPEALAAGGRVWSFEVGLTSAIGRLMSGPPVSAEEFARLGNLSEQDGVEMVMGLVRSGLCEPCRPPEPLI